jgi:hypothetical protein
MDENTTLQITLLLGVVLCNHFIDWAVTMLLENFLKPGITLPISLQLIKVLLLGKTSMLHGVQNASKFINFVLFK